LKIGPLGYLVLLGFLCLLVPEVSVWGEVADTGFLWPNVHPLTQSCVKALKEA